MKKVFLFAAMLSITVAISAQTSKVQSAYSDMKNERLANAKKNIDDACVNEKTKNDAKTWNYAGLIYAQLVDASNNNPKLYKKQKIDTPVETLCTQGINALKKCLEIEAKDGTHEYTQSSIEALKVLCGYEYMFAGNVYNDGKYEEAANKFGQLIEDAKLANHKDIILDAMYYQADSYRMLKQSDKEMNIYREMAKLNTDKADVYLKIYADNKQKNDTTKAINALKKGVKMTANNKENNELMKSSLASAYLWAKQENEANKIIEELLQSGANNPKTLNAVAGIYDEQANTEKAIELYQKSLQIDKNQIDAHRGLGLTNFNKAVDLITEAANIPLDDEEGYNKKIKESFDYFEKAIPHFQEALKIKDNDFQSLKALTTIYSRLDNAMIEESKRNVYKEQLKDVSAKLNKLIQK